MNRVFIWGFILIIVLFSAFAHTNHDNSGELSTSDVIIRVQNIVDSTYTMSCQIPTDFTNQTKIWNVRIDGGDIVSSIRNTNTQQTFDLTLDTMYHIECGALNNSGQYIGFDFHLDLRSQPDPTIPDVSILSAYDLDITAQCLPPQGVTNYNIQWFWNHASQNIPLSEFNNMNVINATSPGYGLWEISCGTYNLDEPNESLRWSQYSSTLEFFPNSEPYIPSANGCMPWEVCDEQSNTQIVTFGAGHEFTLPDVQPWHPTSYEQVVVRTKSVDGRNYTFTCDVPSTADTFRTWTIHTADQTLLNDYQTYSEEISYEFTTDEYFHISCAVWNSTNIFNRERIMSDFHIDLQAEPYTDRPNIEVIHTHDVHIGLSCSHPTSQNYNIQWWVQHPQTGQSWQLDEFNGISDLHLDIPLPGLWDFTCGIWDNEQNQWSQNGMPIEMFEEGPAYIGSITGCVTGEDCIVQNTNLYVTLDVLKLSETQAQFNCNAQGGSGNYTYQYFVDDAVASQIQTVTPTEHNFSCIVSDTVQITQVSKIVSFESGELGQPVWIEPSANQSDVDPFDFHINVFNIDDVAHSASDFEVWDIAQNEIAWASYENEQILYHIHNGDGDFLNSYTGTFSLLENTNYQVRARFLANGTVGTWSEWRFFSTNERPVLNATENEWTVKPGYVIEKVASNINLPTVLDGAPDIYQDLPFDEQPKLYVTQLYGQIGVLLQDGTYNIIAQDLLNFEIFGSLPGSGEIGLTGLYVDETTGDLFVTIVYNHELGWGYFGRVERFELDTDGQTVLSRTVILDDLPVAPAHHIHKITRGPDGLLYLNIGDDDFAGRSLDPNYLSGKIIRFYDDGSMPDDNPYPGTYIYSMGYRNPFGGAWRPNSTEYYVSHNGPDENDGIYKVTPGFEAGWCCDTQVKAWHTWEQTVAPTGLIWDDGTSVFPDDSYDTLYSALSGKTYEEGPGARGKRISQFAVNEDGSKESLGELARYTGSGYGTVIDVTFLDDGLYFTDLYGKNGFIGFTQTNGNIYRIVPDNYSQTPTNETQNESFSAGFGVARWYPQGTHVIWECKPDGGSTDYQYSFEFGDGTDTGFTTQDNVYHVYSSFGSYNASCSIKDMQTQEIVTAHTIINLGLSDYTFEIDASVPSQIMINGQSYGTTPKELTFVEGEYDLTLTATGYSPFSQTYSLTRNINVFADMIPGPHNHSGHYHVGENEILPSVTLAYNQTHLLLQTQNYTFFEPAGQMAAHVVGQGHAHWYIDNVKQGRVYTPEFKHNLSAGEYDIKVILSTNDHKEYMYNNQFIEDETIVIIEDIQQNNSGNGSGSGGGSGSSNGSLACYESLENMPVSCNTGEFVSSSYNGCLTLVCSDVSVMACEKTDYFEAFKLSGSGSVTIGTQTMDTTISGFLRSENYPICTGEPPIKYEVTFTSNTPASVFVNDVFKGDTPLTIELLEDTFDIRVQNTFGSESFVYEVAGVDIVYTELPTQGEPTDASVQITMAPWWPQGTHAVLNCEATGFIPSLYTWNFGDGNSNSRTSSDVYVIYASVGTYDVSCTATDGVTTQQTTKEVTI